MISQLTGRLVEKNASSCVVDVSGVGYEVFIPLSTLDQLPDIGETVTLTIHTHVREDILQLFGFADRHERTVFRQLIGISGVGPKMALGILSGLPAQDLTAAVVGEDVERLVAIPGIGRKTAERIIVELKDKLAKQLAAGGMPVPSSVPSAHREIIDALTGLGYKRQQVEHALRKVRPEASMPLAEAIRITLKELA